MDASGASAESVQRVTWPLIGSLILTGVVVAFVCVPPFSGLHSLGRLVWLACVYILTAACVHVLAVWSIYRIQAEGVLEWTRVWPVVWGLSAISVLQTHQSVRGMFRVKVVPLWRPC